ncbi:unnamed protein product [Kuraishia capsulata CBS 1993]|uniref:Agmatinase n=1 Tax=Kuraishia capsulata CBS 1993 TaxID=1382522 RepID=W6MPN7_9ASCO|nr:uncharacterized protein KUCA_T00003089001 [Kuraishia capsulata CBS 1993]CDK27112.1 unnamed protein product [Kuraishia capsulata CBS 1993]
MTNLFLAGLLFVGSVCAFQSQYDFYPQAIADKEPTLEQLWGEDWPFSGMSSFAHLNYTKCLLDNQSFDVGIIGVPFDTATTYRPGARFGPKAIRSASQRQTTLRGFNHRARYNPYQSWATILDCGDIPITPMDNSLALKQMTQAFVELLQRRSSSADDSHPPRLIALGGDHSILLPHLRALAEIYGKISVIHFDAHLDTWLPSKYPSFWNSDQSKFTHGSMLWMAHEEGLITDDSNVHIGLRTRLSGTTLEDYDDDDKQGFLRIEADEIWLDGIDTVVQKVLAHVPNDVPVYISVDIDSLDPGFAPGTGTIEPGGLLPRELIQLLRRLEGLNLVGADVVEVSPAFDHAEVTATNAAQVVYELLTSMVKKGKPLPAKYEEQHVIVNQEENTYKV